MAWMRTRLTSDAVASSSACRNAAAKTALRSVAAIPIGVARSALISCHVDVITPHVYRIGMIDLGTSAGCCPTLPVMAVYMRA